MLRAVLAALVALMFAAPALAQEAERVEFRSLDDKKTTLVGYLYKPVNPAPKAPAVVLMHGRSGLYSSKAEGVYDQTTLTSRHTWWAKYWAKRGYYALLVDGFGPRGYPAGFGRFTYNDRPAELNEVTIRPLDAYGALQYLRTLEGVDGQRAVLMGWSNGGSATLAAMADDKPGDMEKLGFKAGLSFYPGCGLKGAYERRGYRPYAPVEIYMGTADEEVSPKTCRELVRKSKRRNAPIELVEYVDATHSFDTPIKSRQSVEANAAATADVRERVAAFVERVIGPAR